MIRIVTLLGLLGVAACGAVQPATPGHEPPTSDVNPETGQKGGHGGN